MLGLPGALATAGLALGSLFLVCFAGMSALGLHLLSAATRSVAGDATVRVGFYAVAHRAAPSLTSLIDTAVAIKCFGVATSYLIVVGDSMPKVVLVSLPRRGGLGARRGTCGSSSRSCRRGCSPSSRT